MRGRAGGLTAVAIICLGVAGFVVGNGPLAEILLRHGLAQATDAKIIVGDARLSVWPSLTIVAHKLHIGVPGDRWTLAADRFETSVAIASFFGRPAAFDVGHLDRPRLRLTLDGHSAPSFFERWPALDIVDGTLDYEDAARGTHVQVTQIRSETSKIGIDRRRVVTTGRIDGHEFRLAGEGPALAALLSGDRLPATLDLDLPGLLPHTLAARGQIETVNNGMRLQDLDARSGAAVFTGAVALDVGRAEIQVSADLTTDTLDVSEWPASSTLALPRAFDATLRLAVAHARWGQASTGDLRVAATLQDGGLRLRLSGGTAATGHGEADLFLDSRTAPPRARLQIDLRDADLQALVSSGPATGRLTFKADLQGTGATATDLAAAVRGTATFNLRQNVRLGPAWTQALGAPAFDAISGTFQVAEGAARTCDLRFSPSNIRVDGCGRIDLTTGSLTLDVVRTEGHAESGAHIGGSWLVPQRSAP